MSYPREKLKNFIDVLSGFAFKSKDFTSAGVPVIKIKNVTPPTVTLDDLSYVSKEIAQAQNRFLLNYADVLIALTGSHINQMASVVGRVARVRHQTPSLLNQRVGKITVINPDEMDLDYVYYYLSQDLIKIQLASKAGGAANQANISPSDVKNLDIPFPNIDVQRRISGILSAYDNLIENNQKQIKLLEEAARRLYKEWFVNFRFPGYEDTPIVDGVPEGWSLRPISDFGEVVTGKTPSTEKKEYYGGNIPFVKIPDMHGCVYPVITESSLTEAGAKTQINKFIPRNGIMVSCIATVGLVNIAVERCQTNQQINSIILSDERDLYYVFSAMTRLKELLEGVGSNGATMTNVNKTKFASLPVLYPSEELRDSYYSFCKPIFEKIYNLSLSVVGLKKARDRLLPKLMSGEIEV